MGESGPDEHSQHEHGGVAVPLPGHDDLASRAPSRKGEGKAGKSHSDEAPEVVHMGHGLAFKSGLELSEQQVDHEGRYEEGRHAAEEVAVPEHDEVSQGPHRAEPAFLGHPSDEKANAESYGHRSRGGTRSGCGEEDGARPLGAEKGPEEKKGKEGHSREGHNGACPCRGLGGPAEAEPVPQKDYSDAYADSESADAGDGVPVAARQPGVGPPRASEEDKGPDHGEETEKEPHNGRGTGSRLIFPAEEGGKK
ncbi:hypothetical protein SDC9_82637 [bioreactor metagenome]|uniref:Uncharacterized protein n=1 Tax=bioreactor metagenome TaxID=1076179 RepID=A0A644Z5E3_9ZZZZ